MAPCVGGGGSVLFWFIDINLLLKGSILRHFLFFSHFTKISKDSSFFQVNLLNAANGDFPGVTCYPVGSKAPSFQCGNGQFFYSLGLRVTLRSSTLRFWVSPSGGDKNIECHLLCYRLYGLAAKGNVFWHLWINPW